MKHYVVKFCKIPIFSFQGRMLMVLLSVILLLPEFVVLLLLQLYVCELPLVPLAQSEMAYLL